ncbi:uncharacterized protein LOC119296248 isoform X2 [Triticum dicoccoides]|uniref:uncharacterized protein LOC119296248 isoform X2 n=1 Tax=Triticum dicoccoides TaxID=85692 RepID=UPI00188FC390|nr:uncharacterized protein LOC119296248 isoform X2 [Triticum dicoccoides]
MEPATGIMGKTTVAEQWTPEAGRERGRQCGAEEGVHVVSVSAHLQLAGERFTEIVASPYYMLPEALKHNYCSEIVVWIVGVILYILPCGVQTFLEGRMARQLEGGHAHLAEMVQAVKNHGAGALHFASGCKMAEVCEYLLRLSRWTWMLLTKQGIVK